MIAERSHTAQQIIEQISASSPKVRYFDGDSVSRALMQLEKKGIPSNKHEDYKYCNVDGVFKKEFKNLTQDFVGVDDVKKYRLEDTIMLVVLNGSYSESLSDKVLLNGLRIKLLGEESHKVKAGSVADVESDSFIALNTAFCSGGIEITVERNTDLQIPIHILYVNASSSQTLVNPRNLIRVEEGASACIIEQAVNAGEGKMFCNLLSEKWVAAGARLETFNLQEDAEQSYSVYTSQVELQQNARYDNTTVTFGGDLVRNNHNVLLKGSNSEAHLYGLFSGNGSQLIDNHTLVDHQVPHCESNELYKGMVSGKGTGVFNGKIFVRRDAQKTNAYQSSKNILLSDDATINTKPQLEIYADDVKCSHGTSTGKIDREALFYLKSRGIGEESARKLLLASFAGEVLEKITVDSLKEKAYTLFEKKLQH